MRKYFKKIFNKLTLKGYRDQLLFEYQNQLIILVQIKDQLFLTNPVLVINNIKIYLPLFYVDHIQKLIYQSRNFYELETLEFLRLHYRSFEQIVDIGSNIGNHMLYYCSSLGAKKVHCFEPNRFNLDVLEKNIELNLLSQMVSVYPFALGSETGKGIQSNFSLHNTGMNRVDKINESQDQPNAIDIRSLDDFNLREANFIKIDVEGFELEVLQGAEQTIRSCKPVILIEVFENSRQQVDALMQHYGYRKFITLEEYNSIYVPV